MRPLAFVVTESVDPAGCGVLVVEGPDTANFLRMKSAQVPLRGKSLSPRAPLPARLTACALMAMDDIELIDKYPQAMHKPPMSSARMATPPGRNLDPGRSNITRLRCIARELDAQPAPGR